MQKHILIVDDNTTNLRIAENALKPTYKVTLLKSGEQAIKFLAKNIPDLILLDIKMPGMDGFETIKKIKENPKTTYIPVIFLTALSETESEINGLQLGAADFITKPFVPEVMLRRVSMQIELSEYRHSLERLVKEKTLLVEKLQDAIVISITELVEFRDELTGGHARRSGEYFKLLVNNLCKHKKYKDVISEEYKNNMFRAAPLHDVGKIGINDNILLKTGMLDNKEYEFMKQHTTLGGLAFDKALEEIPNNELLQTAKEIAFYHHEYWDGTGYPNGLSREDIPLSARIMAIADVYDAITNRRSYKEASSHDEAVEIIKGYRGTHFDPEIVDIFLECSDGFKKLSASFKEE